jgi:hypothetical protein
VCSVQAFPSALRARRWRAIWRCPGGGTGGTTNAAAAESADGQRGPGRSTQQSCSLNMVIEDNRGPAAVRPSCSRPPGRAGNSPPDGGPHYKPGAPRRVIEPFGFLVRRFLLAAGSRTAPKRQSACKQQRRQFITIAGPLDGRRRRRLEPGQDFRLGRRGRFA